jgi:hypothetical protein
MHGCIGFGGPCVVAMSTATHAQYLSCRALVGRVVLAADGEACAGLSWAYTPVVGDVARQALS